MEKTIITAVDGKQELTISRNFDLPVAALFRAHSDPAILAQWMGTKVLTFEGRKYGRWAFETCNPSGEVMFKASGVFHDFVPNEKLTRTFQMDNTPFEAQLEFFEFSSRSDTTSTLVMHIIYRSVELRDQMVEMGFSWGLNMAHNRLQDVVGQRI